MQQKHLNYFKLLNPWLAGIVYTIVSYCKIILLFSLSVCLYMCQPLCLYISPVSKQTEKYTINLYSQICIVLIKCSGSV